MLKQNQGVVILPIHKSSDINEVEIKKTKSNLFECESTEVRKNN